MGRQHRKCTIPALLVCAVLSASGADGDDPTTDELISRERVRAGVEAALESYLRAARQGSTRLPQAIRSVTDLVAIGPDAVPYLANELEQGRHETFDLCAYALGRIPTPQSEDALRQAVTRAEEEATAWARKRKAWAIWALGLQGKPDGMLLLNEGLHKSSTVKMHAGTTVLEAVALQTAPASVPLLFDLLAKEKDNPELWKERRATLRALRRANERSALPKLLPYLEHEDPITRRTAATTVAGLGGSKKSIPALIRLLDDEDRLVRRTAAIGLEALAPRGRERDYLARLETETDVITRGTLYRCLARSGNDQAYAMLHRFRASTNVMDRRRLVDAMALVPDPRRVDFLQRALRDPDNTVAQTAAKQLGRIGGESVLKALIEAMARANLTLSHTIPQELARSGRPEAALAIARRMTEDLSRDSLPVQAHTPLQRMGQALVRLRHTAVLPVLLRARERGPHHRLAEILDTTIEQLELVEHNGSSAERWIETLTAEAPEMRELAYDTLAAMDDEKALRALIGAFDTAPAKDRKRILLALDGSSSSLTIDLLERVLQDPEFDAPDLLAVRDAAAWSARRIGGPAMYERLAAAAKRRSGQEVRVLIYAALAGGKRSLSLLRDLRRERMTYLGWYRGNEQDKLDWIARRLEAGLSIEDVDLPPDKLNFRG